MKIQLSEILKEALVGRKIEITRVRSAENITHVRYYMDDFRPNRDEGVDTVVGTITDLRAVNYGFEGDSYYLDLNVDGGKVTIFFGSIEAVLNFKD